MSDFQMIQDEEVRPTYTPAVWIRRKNVTPTTKCDICDLLAKGYSHYTIAKMSSCTIATVITVENLIMF